MAGLAAGGGGGERGRLKEAWELSSDLGVGEPEDGDEDEVALLEEEGGADSSFDSPASSTFLPTPRSCAFHPLPSRLACHL